jgi:hypothetical protein
MNYGDVCMQAIGADGIVGPFDRGHGRGRTGGFWALGRSHRMRPQLFLRLMKQKREELLFPTDTSLPHRRDEADYIRGNWSSWCKKKCRFAHLPRTNEIPPTRLFNTFEYIRCDPASFVPLFNSWLGGSFLFSCRRCDRNKNRREAEWPPPGVRSHHRILKLNALRYAKTK